MASEQRKDRRLMEEVDRRKDEYAQDSNGVWHHLTKRGREVIHLLAVPSQFRADILDSIHKHPSGGHFGVNKTVNKVWQKYYWPGLYQDVVNYIEQCGGCRMHKGKALKATLQSIPCTAPWQDLTCDILGPFHMTLSGNKYILSFVDRFTSWVEAFPIPSCQTPVLAQILVDEIISRHGVMKTILSDNGPSFVSSLMQEVCKILGMKKITTTPYHCKTNGMCERFHRSIARSLAQFTNRQQEDWDKYLPMILFAYRTSVNESRKFTPFFLNYGFEANLPTNVEYVLQDEDKMDLPTYAIWLKETLTEFWRQSKENFEKAQLSEHRRHIHGEDPYKKGDIVYVRNQKKEKGKSFKLQRMWLGPFTVIKEKHPIYCMKIKRREQWIHFERLKKHLKKSEEFQREINVENIQERNDQERNIEDNGDEHLNERAGGPEPILQNYVNPDPEVEVEEDLPTGQYHVEKIVSHKKHGKRYLYRIRWKGYTEDEDTWEYKSNIHPDLVRKYWIESKENKQTTKSTSISTLSIVMLLFTMKFALIGATELDYQQMQNVNVVKSIEYSMYQVIIENIIILLAVLACWKLCQGSKNGRLKTAPKLSYLFGVVLLMRFGVWNLVHGLQLNPNLMGPLYDCSTIQQDRMVRIKGVEGCGKHITSQIQNRTTRFFLVNKYFINKTPMKIYHCEHNRVTMKCKKEFFGSNTKSHSVTSVVVSTDEC